MSHIVVESIKVLEAAEAVISRIVVHRAEKDEKAIEKAMQKKKGFFSNRRNLTREEAVEYLDEIGRKNWHMGWKSYYAWESLDRAKKLVILAQNGDPVTIDADDAELLWG